MFSNRLRELRSCVFLYLFFGCSPEVARDNPYDPTGPGPKEPGHITGLVYVEGAATQEGVAVHFFDDEGGSAPAAATAADGRFTSGELSPGLYSLSVDVPIENVPLSRSDVEVLPGQTKDVGLLVATLAPADGRIRGTVTIENSAESAAAVRVVAIRRIGELAQSWVQYTDASGAYSFEALPPGSFELRADKERFTPDWARVVLNSSARDTAEAPPLKLYPASAVVRFSVANSEGELVIGAPYTRTREVNLLLLAFGGVNEMRFSESPDFVEGGEEVAWRDHMAEIQMALSAGEGPKSVHAQFRVVDPETSAERLRTEAYTASIVLDETAPVLVDFAIAPDLAPRNGVRYVTGDITAVPVELVAVDAFSFVAGVKVVVENADPSLVPYEDITSFGASTSYSTLVSLSPADGLKQVGVQTRDGAGNESVIVFDEITLDTTPPLELASPGISVAPVLGSDLTSRGVTLAFAVGGEESAGIDGPTLMAYGTSPAPSVLAWVPFQAQVDVPLSLGHGAVVSFYGRFADNAGNVLALDTAAYTVNLRGSLTGTVYIEAEPDAGLTHGGTQVDLFAAQDDPATSTPFASGVTNADGTFSLADLDAGTYQVRLSRAAAISALISPVLVSAAQVTSLGVHRLALMRGDLRGSFQKADLGPSGNHGGILVRAILAGRAAGTALTDDEGLVFLSGLPIGSTYEIRASADGYATKVVNGVAVSHNAVTEIEEGAVQYLAKLSGDFNICNLMQPPPPADPADCLAVLYTNESEVLLGLSVDPATVTHVRYALEDPANPGEGSFEYPAEGPQAGPPSTLCSSPPAEGCWNPFSASTQYTVDLSGAAEGIVSLVVQFYGADNTKLPVQLAQVVYDTTPPFEPEMVIRRGALALMHGFTNTDKVILELSAVATYDDPEEAAPMESARVSNDAVWDGDGADGDRLFTYGGTELFELDTTLDPLDGPRTLWAWLCDAAGNCTPDVEVVARTIVLDRAKPSLARGRDVMPVGSGITASGVRTWLTRGTSYSVEVALGDSLWDVEREGAPFDVPEVAAFQISTSPQFTGAAWTPIDFDFHDAGDVVSAGGASLPPVDWSYPVYARFQDVAGNISDDSASDFVMVLDTTAPSASMRIDAGAMYTRFGTVTLDFDVTPTGDAVKLQVAVDSLLPAPYPDPDTRSAFADPLENVAVPAPAGGFGTSVVLARLFDPAGNYVELADSIIVDTAPPAANAYADCASCTFYDSQAYFNDALGQVTLAMFASDPSGIAEVEVAVDAGTAGEHVERLAYAPLAVLTVSSVAGGHTLDATFVDGAGNRLPLARTSIDHDHVAPATASVVIAGDALETSTTAVMLTLSADDGTGSGVVRMAVANGSIDCGTATYEPYVTSKAWTLTSGGSLKTVGVCFQDRAGNTASDTDEITLDTLPPESLSVTVGSGAYTRAAAVSVAIGAVGATQMCMAGDITAAGNCADPSAWEDYGTSKSVTLTGGDGTKSVVVKFRDAAGNVSEAGDTIVLDTQEPYAGAMTLTPTTYAKLPAVTAAFAVSGASEMCVYGDFDGSPADSCVDGSPGWEALLSTKVLSLTAGDGIKTISVKYGDAAGWITTAASASITLDATSPASGSVTINGGDTHTNSPSVSLTLAATDALSGIAEVAVANTTIACDSVAYQPFVSSLAWTLVALDDSQTVLVCFKDRAGNTLESYDTITLDRQAPTGAQVIIAGGDAYVTDRNDVALSLSATGAHQMCITGDLDATPVPDCVGTGWVDYVGSASRTLTSGDGTKQVLAYFRDQAGNQVQVSDTVTLDTSKPYGEILVLSPTDYTSDTGVTVALGASGASEMCLWGDFAGSPADCGPGSLGWEEYRTSTSLTLSAADGVKTVSVKYRDAAGLESLTAPSDSVVLDGTDPVSGSIIIDGGDAYATSLSVTLTLAADDGTGSGIAQMAIANQSISCASASYEAYATSKNWTLIDSDALQTVLVCFKDRAGNTLEEYNTITLDRQAPTSASLTLAGGVTYTKVAAGVSVTLYAAQASEMCLTGDLAAPPDCLTVGWEEYATTASADLVAGDDVKIVTVHFRDAAGNTTSTSDSIILDTTPPDALTTRIELDPTTHTTSPAVVASLAAAGATRICLYGDIIGDPGDSCADGSAGWTALVSTKSVTLSAGNGGKTVYAKFADDAGWISDPVLDSVTYDNVAPSAVAATVGVTGPCAKNAPAFRCADVTRDRNVTVAIDGFADATTTVVDMQVANDIGFTGASWQPYAASLGWTLSGGDEVKSVYVRVRDDAGNVSTHATGNIELDTTPPDFSAIEIRGQGYFPPYDTMYTHTRRVELAFAASDDSNGGVYQQRASRSTIFTSAWAAYDGSISGFDLKKPTIPTCRQGLAINEIDTGATARVELVNRLGAAVDLQDWVIECGLDGSAVTLWTLPQLTVGAYDYVVVSEAAGTNDAQHIYMGTSCGWTAGAAGYAVLRDPLARAVDFVRFNNSVEPAPTGVAWAELSPLTGGTVYGRALEFDRDLASEWCLQAAFSDAAANTDACGVVAGDCVDLDHPEAPAYVEVRDEAGNTAQTGSTIFLDMTPPTVAMTIDSNSGWSRLPWVFLSLTASDGAAGSGVVENMISEDPSLETIWWWYRGVEEYSFSTDGPKRLFARVRDAAGNESPAYWASDSVRVDTSFPSLGTVSLEGTVKDGAASTTLTGSTYVTVTLSGFADSGGEIASVRVYPSPENTGEAVLPYTEGMELGFTLPVGDGLKTVCVDVTDAAGNTTYCDAPPGTSGWDQITLDTAPPSGAVMAIQGGNTYHNASTADVTLSVLDDAEEYLILPSGSWTACSASPCSENGLAPETISGVSLSVEGYNVVQILLRDAAGNVTYDPAVDDIIRDTVAPSPAPTILSATPWTTSIYVDLDEAQDVTSGVDAYVVGFKRKDDVDWPAFNTVELSRSEGWVLGLPSLEQYDFRALARDRAGNETAWSPLFRTLVGLKSSLVGGFDGIGSMADRMVTYRGFVLFPRLVSGMGGSYELWSCDARRQRCQAGLMTSTVGIGMPTMSTLHDVTMVADRDRLWLLGLLWDGFSSHWELHAKVFDGVPDEIPHLDSSSWHGYEDLAHLGNDPAVSPRPRSMAAASNGNVIAVAYIRDNGPVSEIWYHQCSLENDCTAADSWSSSATPLVSAGETSWEVNSSTAVLSMDAGDDSIWITYPVIDGPDCSGGAFGEAPCKFAVLGCRNTADCGTTMTDWVKVKVGGVIGTQKPITRTSSVLEVGDRLYVIGVQDVANATARGLYLWSCGVDHDPSTDDCITSAQFSDPVLLEPVVQSTIFTGGSSPAVPRLSFDHWGGYVHTGITDFGIGEVIYARCNVEGPSACGDAADWTVASVLKTGAVNGQAYVGVLHGSPLVLVGRDTSRAYLLEPPTPTPLQRALIPDFDTGGIRATWVSRQDDVEGFRVDVTRQADGTRDLVVAPDPASDGVSVKEGTDYTWGDAYSGVVASYSGQDLGMAEPHFNNVRTSGRHRHSASIGTLTPKYARSASCHAVLWNTQENNLFLSTCSTGSACTDTGWSNVMVQGGGTAFGDTALAVSGSRVYVSYVYASPPTDVFVEVAEIAADCNVNPVGFATQAQLYSYDGFYAVADLHMQLTDSRVYLLYHGWDSNPGPGHSEEYLRTCSHGSACTTADEWTGGVAAAYQSRGGAMAVTPSYLYWAHRQRPATANVVYVDRCQHTSSTCEGPGSYSGWHAALGDAPVQRLDIQYQNGKLLLTNGSQLAWCDETDETSGCTSTNQWNRAWFSPDLLGSMEPFASTLGRTALGDFVLVGLSNGGHSMAVCRHRCWHPDSWIGGFSLLDTRTITTFFTDKHYGPVAWIDPGSGPTFDTSGAATVLFRYRDAQNGRLVWQLVTGAQMEYSAP